MSEMGDGVVYCSPEAAASQCRHYFENGFYCAESVLMAIAEVNGVESKGLPRLMTGLCGGLSLSGGPCGALLGGIAAFGLFVGRSTSEDESSLCFGLSRQLIQEFEQIFGSRNCYGVLPCDISNEGGREFFREKELRKSVCTQVVEKTALLVQELINSKEEMADSL